MNYNDEKIANLIISLKKLRGVGTKTIQKFLLENSRDLKEVKKFDEGWLRNKNNKAISKGLDSTTISWNEIQKQSSQILERAYNEDIKVVHPYMSVYPRKLLTLKNFPPILYGKGNIELLNSEKSVAIIGTRNPTNLGLKLGERLSEKLARDGYTVVSGLAVGSDTIGHVGALNVGGHTIAILPTPIDSPVYPKENQKLADEIVEKSGLLISEYAPGTKLYGRELVTNLISRDEWQSGICSGVIAIETGVKGGTNHAIKHAIDTNTPLAIFDYSSQIGDTFFKDERFGGNVKYISNKNAYPIYTIESIEFFKSKMENYYNEILRTENKFSTEKKVIKIESNCGQTKLF